VEILPFSLLETASINQNFAATNQHLSSLWKQLKVINMTTACGSEII
jgi:hypothetical protein